MAQRAALREGKSFEQALAVVSQTEKDPVLAAQLAQHRVHPGGRPSTLIVLTQLDAKQLGSLLALYEHKVFTEGVLWGINPFDQWGVEFGKKLAILRLHTGFVGLRATQIRSDAPATCCKTQDTKAWLLAAPE